MSPFRSIHFVQRFSNNWIPEVRFWKEKYSFTAAITSSFDSKRLPATNFFRFRYRSKSEEVKSGEEGECSKEFYDRTIFKFIHFIKHTQHAYFKKRYIKKTICLIKLKFDIYFCNKCAIITKQKFNW